MNSSDSLARFNRRRRLTRRVRLRAMLAAGVAVAALGFLAWVVFFSPWLATDTVAVAGTRTISVREVEAAAGVPVGTPLVRVDLDKIKASVAKLPAVKTVAVRRSWPHTIAIAITERQPVASVYRSGTWQVLDARGVAFRSGGARPQGIPVIAVNRSAAADLLRDTARVAAALPADLSAQIRRITAVSMDSVTLRLKNSDVVMWGSSAESYRKVEVLKALMVHGKASRYDVSVPGQPATAR
jgi:cell division protein FtsQ